MQGTVISLCDRSGNALRPWAEQGYHCIAVDTAHDGVQGERVGEGCIIYVEADVQEWRPPADAEVVFGMAWPPCTDLAVSGARWLQEKGLQALADAIEIVGACVDLLEEMAAPWLLENPVSTLSTHWREPDHTFNPGEYAGYTDRDESYNKKTCLWTSPDFRMQSPDYEKPREEWDDRIHEMQLGEDRAEKRAETPLGFARAVQLANDPAVTERPELYRQTEQAELTHL